MLIKVCVPPYETSQLIKISRHQQLLENAISMAPTSQTTFLDSAFKLSVLDSANTPSILNTITQSEYIDAQLSQF